MDLCNFSLPFIAKAFFPPFFSFFTNYSEQWKAILRKELEAPMDHQEDAR